jgi:hypothetical protein
MHIINPTLTLLDIMRAANVPAGQDNESLIEKDGLLSNCFDSMTGDPRPECAATLEGYVVKNIAGFFSDHDYADEPLSARIQMMAGALNDATADLWRIAQALEQLAEDVADAEATAEEQSEAAAEDTPRDG